MTDSERDCFGIFMPCLRLTGGLIPLSASKFEAKWVRIHVIKSKTPTEVSAEVSLELQSNTQKQHAQSDMSMLDP